MIDLYTWIGPAAASLLVAWVACISMFEAPARGDRLPLRDCHVDGIAEQVRCGSFDVFEDRDRASGKRISIQVTVVPALVRDAAPDPLIMLAGGPGQGARSYARLVPPFFQRIRRNRDIVLVDLRGTGDSSPLECTAAPGAAAFISSGEPIAEWTRRCLAGLSADPTLYTHRNALADLHDAIRRLGYAQVNLWGGSWGTRAALIFAARYPTLVRTVTLDGAVAAGIDFPWSYPADATRAFDRLLADCAATPECQRAFPGARGEIAGWLAELERHPVSTTVRHPRTGGPMDVQLDRASATEIVRAALYSPTDSSRLLMAIHLAAAGDLSAILALAERSAGWSLDTMALGQTLSILCSEDVGRHPPAEPPRDTIFGTSAVDAWFARCAGWPRGPALDIDEHTEISTPALIVSGELDPVTPPARGDAMRRHFPDSVHLVAPGGGHNVSFTGCIPQVIARFVEQGHWRSLDAACVQTIRRPPFVTSLAGAQP